jgi:hypothetical protein
MLINAVCPNAKSTLLRELGEKAVKASSLGITPLQKILNEKLRVTT